MVNDLSFKHARIRVPLFGHAQVSDRAQDFAAFDFMRVILHQKVCEEVDVWLDQEHLLHVEEGVLYYLCCALISGHERPFLDVLDVLMLSLSVEEELVNLLLSYHISSHVKSVENVLLKPSLTENSPHLHRLGHAQRANPLFGLALRCSPTIL